MNPLALIALGFAGWLLLSGKISSSAASPCLVSPVVPPRPTLLRPILPIRETVCSSLPVVHVAGCVPLISNSAGAVKPPLNPNLKASCQIAPGVFAPDQQRCTLSRAIHKAVGFGNGGCNPGSSQGAITCDGEFCKMFK